MSLLSLRTGSYVGGGTGIMVLAVMFATFSIGSLSGAYAATNESATVESQLTALDSAEVNATEQIRENVSGAESGALVYIDPLIDAGFTTAKIGVRWGYRHPRAAVVLAKLTDDLLVGFMVAYVGWILWRAGVISMLREWRLFG